jgi:hypothetical protein
MNNGPQKRNLKTYLNIMYVKNAVKIIFVWFNIENVRESRFLYDICSKLFCSA